MARESVIQSFIFLFLVRHFSQLQNTQKDPEEYLTLPFFATFSVFRSSVFWLRPGAVVGVTGPAIRHAQYAVRYTIYALEPPAVPAWVVAMATRVAVRIGHVSRAGDDNCAVTVTVVVADVLVGEIAACDGDCDYYEYDCRY